MKINKRFLPVKLHYFFFMASMGPILPQLSVFGKQLGISSDIMGTIAGLLPIFFLLAKPAFGFLVDYFQSCRKIIFMALLVLTSTSYSLFYFIPVPVRHQVADGVYNLTVSEDVRLCNNTESLKEFQCTKYKRAMCHSLNCDDSINYINISALVFLEEHRTSICALEDSVTNTSNTCGNLECFAKRNEDIDCLYGTGTFWAFLILMVIGTIGFNVANSISDAICFDVLGENEEMKYGAQRLWGTLGYGITALISGYFIDYISKGSIKNYTPVFITVILCTIIDIASCVKLQLPKLPQSKNIFKDVGRLVQHHHIIVFLIFATLSGFLGSFISYFLFWYLEDLATQTGDTYNIKLLEGLTIAAQSFGGEVLFFGISGKILKKLGYGHTLTVCFISYGLRFALISHIPSPWWILPIEFVMQGPTYALTYTTIVAYASVIAPPGTSATMQGVVAGMDDGFGYALGSIFAGFVYRYTSGRTALRIYALIGLGCGILHYILYKTCIKISIPKKKESQHEDIAYLSPNNAIELIDDNSD